MLTAIANRLTNLETQTKVRYPYSYQTMFSSNLTNGTQTQDSEKVFLCPQQDSSSETLSTDDSSSSSLCSTFSADSSKVPPPPDFGGPSYSANDLSQLVKKVQKLTLEHGIHHPTVGSIWNCIGNALYHRDQTELTLEALEQAVKCSVAKDSSKEQLSNLANAYSNIATIYWERGDGDLATQYLGQSLDAHRQCGRKSDAMAAVLHQLGVACTWRGEYSHAETYLLQAYALRTSGTQSFAKTCNALGKVAFLQGHFPKALEYHEKAFAVYVGSVAAMDSLRSIAKTYQAMGDDAAALFGFRALSNMQKKRLLESSNCNKAKLRRDIGVTQMTVGDLILRNAETKKYPLVLDSYQQAKFFLLASGASTKHPLLQRLSSSIGQKVHACIESIIPTC